MESISSPWVKRYALFTLRMYDKSTCASRRGFCLTRRVASADLRVSPAQVNISKIEVGADIDYSSSSSSAARSSNFELRAAILSVLRISVMLPSRILGIPCQDCLTRWSVTRS